MNLSDLPARELARLDAVCLEYESALRQAGSGDQTIEADATDIDSLVTRHGGQHADLLRSELEGIRAEVILSGDASSPNPTLPLTSPLPLPSAKKPSGSAAPVASNPVPSNPVPSNPIPAKSAGDNELPPLGTQIGPYRLNSVLGRGGMGIVYRAVDTRLDRSVAFKMLSVGGHEALVQRFQREAKAVASLTHPNIVELFDIGVHDGMPFAVMEHLRGETLMRRMEASRIESEPITVPMVRQWGRELAEALATSHSAGVIHRDLKPDNVMLVGRRPMSAVQGKPSNSISSTINASSGGSSKIPSVKLFDFGLSRVGQSMFGDETEDADTKTRAGMILGTPGYMAPEQARGEMVSSAADVFSLGCVLFEAFYGRPAFTGQTPASRYAAVLEQTPLPDPGRRRDDVALADLITAMMSKAPASRPTAAAVAFALAEPGGRSSAAMSRSAFDFGSGGSTMDRPALVPLPGLDRRRWMELAGGTFAGGLIGFSGLGGHWAELKEIQSIGVLSFTPATQPDVVGEATPKMAAGRSLKRGELLASLIANELSRLEGLSVPKYVPLLASFPKQFKEAAQTLEVDALVTGTYTEPADAGSGVMDVNIQIISAEDGKQLWGKVIRTTAGNNLIEQTELARQVASAINRNLTENESESSPLVSEAFTCLIKGRTQADPDSVPGLRSALACFEHALTEDAEYGPAHAGVALSALTLSARVEDDEAQQLITRSRAAVDQALKLSPNNIDARLAQAMLAYQTLGNLDQARTQLRTLAEEATNAWQVHHQLGWIEMLMDNPSAANRSLRRAASLHSASQLLQSDLARAQWFAVQKDRAIHEANAMLPRTGISPLGLESEKFARGLLIDLHESGTDFTSAGAVDPELAWNPSDGTDAYFRARQKRLNAIPYGPYGPTMNQTILDLRQTDRRSQEPADLRLARLLQTRSPMLPMLLIKHPQFNALRMLPAAGEAFPTLQLGGF